MNRTPHVARVAALTLAFGLGTQQTSFAQGATFDTRSLTPETALLAARAALEQCRKNGWQAAVAVVDRAGLVQARNQIATPDGHANLQPFAPCCWRRGGKPLYISPVDI